MEHQSGRQGPIHWRVVVSTIGAAALFLFPPCCFPINFLAAVPCAQVRARFGPFYGWLVTGVASLIVALATGAMFGPSGGVGFGLYFFGVVAAPAVVMTSWVVRGVRVDHAVLAGLAFCLAFLAALFFFFTLETGESPGDFLLRMHHQQNRETLEMLEGTMTPSQRQELEPLLALFDRMFDYTFAGIGVWFLTGLSLVASIMSRSPRWGAPEYFPPQDQTRVVIPSWGVYLFIVCGLLTLVSIDALRTWCYNILIILVFIYFLGGLSILAWFMARIGVPLVFKILLYLLVMIYWPLSLVTAGAGLFDQWFDFRKLRRTD